MRILFARRDFLDVADGINAFLYPVMEALLQAGHEVHLAGPVPVDREKLTDRFPSKLYPQFHHISTHRPPGWWADTSLWARFWPKLVQTIQPDRIVLNGVLPWRNSVPTLAINHDLQPRGGTLFARLVRMLGYRLAHARAATCTELRQALAKNIFLPWKRIHLIPTCIRVSDFQPRFGEPKKPFILHIGTMPYKHPEKSIAAFRLAALANLRLVITGPVVPWLQEALAQESPNLQQRVDCLGVVASRQLRQHLSEALAVVVPSGYDIPVLSPTVLESFASGAPVICAPSISRDLIRPTINCLVSAHPDETAAQLGALVRDVELGPRLSRQALADVAVFDSIPVAKKIMAVLESLSP